MYFNIYINIHKDLICIIVIIIINQEQYFIKILIMISGRLKYIDHDMQSKLSQTLNDFK
jgi:hypothetical protein